MCSLEKDQREFRKMSPTFLLRNVESDSVAKRPVASPPSVQRSIETMVYDPKLQLQISEVQMIIFYMTKYPLKLTEHM